jgi:AraC family transcriptional regulator
MKNILFCLMLLAATLALPGQDGVSLRDEQPFRYAALECRGAYSQIGPMIGTLMMAAQKQNITMEGGPFAVYHSNPAEVKEADLIWDVAVPIDKTTTVQAPLKAVDFNFKTVVTCIHKGPYATVAETYRKVYAFIQMRKLAIVGPAFETYFDNPAEVKPADMRTEIMIPVGGVSERK